jgi:hypothetical protein
VNRNVRHHRPFIVSLLISIIGVFVSGCIGALTVWLAVRKRLEEETLGKATRKTAAMQLLSDEEFTLEQVRDECIAIGTLIEVGSFGQHRDHLLGETKRIQTEANAMLDEVRTRRQSVERSLPNLSAAELEITITTAYHGKRRAEAQLKRTQLSRMEVLSAFSQRGNA